MSSQIKPWLLLGAIFIVGVVTGSALTVGLGPHFMHSPGPRDMKKHWMTHLTQELNLTADQQAKIQPILTDAETKIQALHRDEMEHGAQIFKAVHDQISALLTPDQQVELLKVESEREKKFSDHMRPSPTPSDTSPPVPPPQGQ